MYTVYYYMRSHIIVVGAVGGLLHRRVLLLVSDLHTHHRVHVEADELPGLDHRDADLKGDIMRYESELSPTVAVIIIHHETMQH